MSICKVCGRTFVNDDARDHHINLEHLRLYGENSFITMLDEKAEARGFKKIILTKEELDNI